MAGSNEDGSGSFLASPLLKEVGDESRRAIASRLEPGAARPGAVLLEQGRPNDRLWFVGDGSLAIERQRKGGPLDLLATLAGPAIFGTTTFFRSTVPSATIRAITALPYWTLDREAHEELRKDDPRAAEALALALVRVLSDRFDLLDLKISGLMAEHAHDHPKASELATFRARLFEDSAT